MKTHVQLRIYFPDDLERIFSNLERIYITANGGREKVEDRFFEFMDHLRGFVSSDPKAHYGYEDIRKYLRTISLISRNLDCTNLAYRAVEEVFDINGKYQYE